MSETIPVALAFPFLPRLAICCQQLRGTPAVFSGTGYRMMDKVQEAGQGLNSCQSSPGFSASLSSAWRVALSWLASVFSAK